TSSTEVKTPAIDDEPPSSLVEDDRTTSGRSPSLPRVRQAARAGPASSYREGCDQPVLSHAVVRTAPGSTGSPARRARARLAALAPTSDPSVAPGSVRSTRSGRRSAGGYVSMAPGWGQALARGLPAACIRVSRRPPGVRPGHRWAGATAPAGAV